MTIIYHLYFHFQNYQLLIYVVQLYFLPTASFLNHVFVLVEVIHAYYKIIKREKKILNIKEKEIISNFDT